LGGVETQALVRGCGVLVLEGRTVVGGGGGILIRRVKRRRRRVGGIWLRG
jgi:hypothetical protein